MGGNKKTRTKPQSTRFVKTSQYVEYVTPKLGDPTYTLLKSHLLFEQLLRGYLEKKLAHPDALDGARLTFSHLLAVAKAVSRDIEPDDWMWKAFADLNTLRNLLAHEPEKDSLQKKLDDYSNFVIKHLGPLPEPAISKDVLPGYLSAPKTLFLKIDMANSGLYGYSSARLYNHGGGNPTDLLED